MLKAAGVRSTQRLALGEVGGGIVALKTATVAGSSSRARKTDISRAGSFSAKRGKRRITCASLRFT